MLTSYYKYPFLPLIIYSSFVEIHAKYTGKHDLKKKNVDFFKFWDIKPIVKFWICEVAKPNLKPKPFPNHAAEPDALTFWNHEAEAEAEALASNASALWSSFYPCLASASKKRRLRLHDTPPISDADALGESYHFWSFVQDMYNALWV